MVLLLVTAGQIGGCSDDEKRDMICLMLPVVCLSGSSSRTDMHSLHEVKAAGDLMLVNLS